MDTSATVDLVGVEAELRAYHVKLSPPGRAPAFTFWPGSAAVDCAPVEELDAVGECQTTALAAARTYGLRVCAGWVASDAHPERPILHFWNRRDDGALLDAARARRTASGYLGCQLTTVEVAQMIDAIEREERMSETGRGLHRLLGALLG